MRYKQIGIALIAASLIAVAFVSTAVASITGYLPPPTKDGNAYVFTIYTTLMTPSFSGLDVDPASIVVTIYNMKGEPIMLSPKLKHVALSADTVVFKLEIPEGCPTHATSASATGSLTTEGTFTATGPGWGWANIH